MKVEDAREPRWRRLDGGDSVIQAFFQIDPVDDSNRQDALVEQSIDDLSAISLAWNHKEVWTHSANYVYELIDSPEKLRRTRFEGIEVIRDDPDAVQMDADRGVVELLNET
ncbi:MAG TPA: hypothetical protein VJ837_01980, partial [Candidatus Paceibacterota bacterium]|nr:hypothetical protein [Candidatus Paceibacterota bacterium]